MVLASLLMAISFVALMKMHSLCKGFIERRPSKYEDESTASWFAWHVQSTIHASAQVWFSLWPIWVLSSAEPRVQYWTPSGAASDLQMQAIARVANGAGVFFAYIFVDCFIAVFRNQMTIDYLIHHLVFMFFCIVIMYDCFAPYLAGWLLLMEASTIFLNSFSFTRNRLGYDHIFVKASFLLFAIAFVSCRLAGTTFIACHFSRSVLLRVPEYDGIPQWHLNLLVVALILAVGIQLYWGFGIVMKLVKVMGSSRETEKGKSDTTKRE